ncbi:alpha-E domain-containing protein [Methylosinus sp. Sm6]|uniref:alpha-E domain-containing protein n=1 Tax=Methylosinus sp. Sm6 TaxID=2866948 RepID=UPI001C99CC2A|nr:alpha-E domain-containing protein [Methylosinus sp. Sm6]MBY6240930.1 alpha-E domain-containing protein [Methylosinus sp. Sm6]
MLSRTADNLYWLARYMERADFLARILQATRRLATLPKAYGGAETEWESALLSSGAAPAFHAAGLPVDEANVTDFLAFSPDNPSSIRNCIELARANARAVRTALTVEMWEAINGAYLELKAFGQRGGRSSEDLTRFLDVVKQVSAAYDGGAHRTMLRNDAYWFSRVGLYIERADNTARLLDVKYHVLLPDSEAVGGSLDYFQWTAILRAVSAHTAYHWVYRDSLKPWLVADLLILRPEMPRSLIACYESVVQNLDRLGKSHGRHGPAQRHGRAVLGQLENATIESVFHKGLHEFIQTFIADNHRLGALVSEQYLF